MQRKAPNRVQGRGVRLPFGDMSEVERVARRQQASAVRFAVRERKQEGKMRRRAPKRVQEIRQLSAAW